MDCLTKVIVKFLYTYMYMEMTLMFEKNEEKKNKMEYNDGPRPNTHIKIFNAKLQVKGIELIIKAILQFQRKIF